MEKNACNDLQYKDIALKVKVYFLPKVVSAIESLTIEIEVGFLALVPKFVTRNFN